MNAKLRFLANKKILKYHHFFQMHNHIWELDSYNFYGLTVIIRWSQSRFTFHNLHTDPQLYIVSLNFISGPETYPVILSLEQHCCPKIQKTSARLFREILGEKLLSEPLEAIHHNSSLPSPSQLLGKIIIKHKKLLGAVDSSPTSAPTSAPTAQSTTPSVDKDSSPACVQEVLFALIVHRTLGQKCEKSSMKGTLKYCH